MGEVEGGGGGGGRADATDTDTKRRTDVEHRSAGRALILPPPPTRTHSSSPDTAGLILCGENENWPTNRRSRSQTRPSVRRMPEAAEETGASGPERLDPDPFFQFVREDEGRGGVRARLKRKHSDPCRRPRDVQPCSFAGQRSPTCCYTH